MRIAWDILAALVIALMANYAMAWFNYAVEPSMPDSPTRQPMMLDTIGSLPAGSNVIGMVNLNSGQTSSIFTGGTYNSTGNVIQMDSQGVLRAHCDNVGSQPNTWEFK